MNNNTKARKYAQKRAYPTCKTENGVIAKKQREAEKALLAAIRDADGS